MLRTVQLVKFCNRWPDASLLYDSDVLHSELAENDFVVMTDGDVGPEYVINTVAFAAYLGDRRW